MAHKEWDAGSVERLHRLWLDGLSTSEISKRINRTKNAVVGKVHRMQFADPFGWPARPDPIRRGPSRVVVTPIPRVHPAVCTLPPLPSQIRAPAVRKPPIPTPPVRLIDEKDPLSCEAEDEDMTKDNKPIVFRPRQEGQCQWLSGKSKPFLTCDDVAEPGRPYCAEHTKMAYIPRPPLRMRAEWQ